MKFYQFKKLIEKYSVSFTLEKAENKDPSTLTADDYDAQGNYIGGSNPPVAAVGALVPLPQRLVYQSGGRLTEADRTLYSTDHEIPLKSKITYRGLVYHVESKTPFEDYADFTQYTLKAVEGVGE
jgi:hypothetical protein